MRDDFQYTVEKVYVSTLEVELIIDLILVIEKISASAGFYLPVVACAFRLELPNLTLSRCVGHSVSYSVRCKYDFKIVGHG